MKLKLGVRPSSYTDPKGIDGNQDATVQEVARGVERKYGLMGKFVEMEKQLIGDVVAQQIINKLEGQKIVGKDLSKISTAFKDSLALKMYDGKIKGVATKASRIDKGWRKNSPRRGFNRPSFVDTGLYKSSMTAELDDA